MDNAYIVPENVDSKNTENSTTTEALRRNRQFRTHCKSKGRHMSGRMKPTQRVVGKGSLQPTVSACGKHSLEQRSRALIPA